MAHVEQPAKQRRGAMVVSVTVVVVNCNGGSETLRCLRSVAASDPPPDRFVLVDNGSTDGTRELIESEYSGPMPITSIWLQNNIGPAAARNIGALNVATEMIAFLDNDTVVSTSWLKEAINTMSELNADCVQCKLVSGTDVGRIDSLGYLLGPFGFPRHIVRPGAIDVPAYARPRLLFGVKSAAMIVTNQAYSKAGGFDPAFFIYGEETDLCWRVLRTGGRIALAPQSVVHHYAGSTGRFLPDKAERLLYRGGTRNYIRMVAKNSPPRRLVSDMAGQIAVWLGMAFIQILRGRVRIGGFIVCGVADAILIAPDTIRQRARTAIPFVDIPRELRMRFSLRYIWHTVRVI